MAPTKCELEETNIGEQVLDLVIPYIHNVEDRNSVSLVSRKSYATDGITVHVHYNPNPASLSNRFPFIESLTLKGTPSKFYGIRITPWIQQLALEFRCLKELHICALVVHDEDLETLARTRGKDLRSLKIKNCIGFSTDGLRHVSNYCNQLRTLSLKGSDYINVKDGIWLHQLALNSTVLEKFHFKDSGISDAEALTILAKNCCNSLISLKTGECYLTRYSIVLPFLNHIRKLKLVPSLRYECQCLLFKRCPNMEVLYTQDECGDRGLQVVGQFCKKLRKLTHDGLVTHVGLIDVAKGCTNLESLNVILRDISNEALKCVGTHLKNLRDFRIWLGKKNGIRDLPLDNGVRAMLMGCNKLERLDISLSHEGLTDVGLEYIGKYGANLRYLSLTRIGKSNAGLVKLSEGCPRLRKLKLWNCPFSKQAVNSYVFNIPSLRYVHFDNSDVDGDRIVLALTRPEFQL